MRNIQTPIILYPYYPKHHSANIFLFLFEFSFMNIFDSQGSRGRGGYLFISSLSNPRAPKTFKKLVDYCRELTSPHSKQTQSPTINKNVFEKTNNYWLANNKSPINDMAFCNSSFTLYYTLRQYLFYGI